MTVNPEDAVGEKLTRLEHAVRRQDSMNSKLTADRRLCTSQVSSQLEILLLSGALDSKIDDDERLRIKQLLKQLSDSLSDGADTLPSAVSLDPKSGISQARAYNDMLLNRNIHDHDDKGEDELACDAYCSLEMQEAVCDLYDALIASWPKHCAPAHEAMLRLTAAPERKKQRRGGGDIIEFDVMISAHSNKWVETKFAVDRSAPVRSIRFADDPKTAPPSNKPVNICHLIESSATDMKYVRVQVNSGQFQSYKYIIGQYGKSSFVPKIPLSALVTPVRSKRLQNLSIESPVLSKKYKAIIAVILAYSFWHLSKDAWGEDAQEEKQWLRRKWTNEGFHFLSTSKHTVDVGRPLLPTVFDSNADEELVDSIHPSPSILAFAMMLIHLQCPELFVSLRLAILAEEKAQNPDLQGEPSNIDYMSALRLLDASDFRNNVDGAYRKAISACLTGEFIEDFWELDESEIRSGFYQHVIVPLKKDLQESWDLTPNDLNNPFEVQIPEGLLHNENQQDDLPDGPVLKTALHTENQQDDLPVGPLPVLKTENTRSLASEELCLFTDECVFRGIDLKDAEYADNWFFKLKERVHPLVRPQPGVKPIKIAILDTGIQLPSTAMVAYEDQIRCCKSWLQGQQGEDLEKGDRDLDGHGTHCASLILQVAQNVSLYVARVFKSRTEKTGPVEVQETQEAIAKAITHAVNVWKVDIISMSFGCKDRVESIHQAITDACNKNVLVFVAASNSGGNDRVLWPARMDRVTCVHATDGNGNSTRFTPNATAHDDNFAVLGSGVKGYWPEALGGPQMRLNGTSCAAPIAAGIAAIILDYTRRTRARHRVFDEYERDFDRLRERHGMSKILHKMAKKDTIARGPYTYIEPWELLNVEDKLYTEEFVLRSILRELELAG